MPISDSQSYANWWQTYIIETAALTPDFHIRSTSIITLAGAEPRFNLQGESLMTNLRLLIQDGLEFGSNMMV